MQSIPRLLQLNLFLRRDLMALLRSDPPQQNGPNSRQPCLVWKFTGTAGQPRLIAHHQRTHSDQIQHRGSRPGSAEL